MAQGLRDLLRRPVFWILSIVAVGLVVAAIWLLILGLRGEGPDG